MSQHPFYGEQSSSSSARLTPSPSSSPTPGPSRGSLKFPQKLWNIVEDESESSVSWTPGGETILIDFPVFQQRFLNKRSTIFKTTNMASFIRQLNLYGFRKVNNQTEIHEYRHPAFKRGRPDLLKGVTRRYPNVQTPTSQHFVHGRPETSREPESYFGGPSTSQGSSWEGLAASSGISPYSTPQRVLGSTSFAGDSSSMAYGESRYLHRQSHKSLFLSSPPSSSQTSEHSDYHPYGGRETPSDLMVSTRKFGELSLPDTSEDDQPLDFRKHQRGYEPIERPSYFGQSSYRQSPITAPPLSDPGRGSSSHRAMPPTASQPMSSRPGPSGIPGLSPIQYGRYGREDDDDDEDNDYDDDSKIINVEGSSDEEEVRQLGFRHRLEGEEEEEEGRKPYAEETDSESDEDEEDDVNISEYHRR